MGHNFNMASLGRAISTLGLRSPIRNSPRAPLASNSYSSFADPKTCDINTVEKVTHTGQKYSEDDYRRVRFIDKEKLVNLRSTSIWINLKFRFVVILAVSLSKRNFTMKP